MNNRRYAKIINDGKDIQFAENILRGKKSVIINPTDADYFKMGYLQYEDIMPKSDNKLAYFIKNGYEQKDGKIVPKYKMCLRVLQKTVTPKGKKIGFIRRNLRKFAMWLIGN